MMENLASELNIPERVPIVHRYVYNIIVNRKTKLLEGIPIDQNMIDRKLIKLFLSRYMCPREIQDVFLQEMESYGLIKQERRKIEILVEK